MAEQKLTYYERHREERLAYARAHQERAKKRLEEHPELREKRKAQALRRARRQRVEVEQSRWSDIIEYIKANTDEDATINYLMRHYKLSSSPLLGVDEKE